MTVGLVGLMPFSIRENTWILVLMDHFTWLADALSIPDASAPTIVQALNQHVFCHFGLSEQIHTVMFLVCCTFAWVLIKMRPLE